MKFHESRASSTVTGESTKPHTPDDLNAWLPRSAAAAALNATGYPISSETLATMASRGGGPKFSRWGSRALYRWRDLLEWAECDEANRHAARPNRFRRLTEARSPRPVVEGRRDPFLELSAKSWSPQAKMIVPVAKAPRDGSSARHARPGPACQRRPGRWIIIRKTSS